MSSRPRLLFVSPRFLFPLDQGGRIRTANILRRMRGGMFEITLASPVPANWQRYKPDIEALCDRFVHWPEPSSSKLSRLMAVANRLPIGVATDVSAEGATVVARELARKPEILLADFPHSAVLLPDGALPPSVMFTHNVEAEIFDRHVTVSKGIWHLVWRDQARKMDRFEGETLRRFDAVIAVSARDGEALKRRFGIEQVELVDTGVDIDYYPFTLPDTAPDLTPDGGTIVFSGAMDARANIDGIEFLMDEVWPLIVAARPAAKMLIVGRNPPANLIARAKSRGLAWEFTGFVEDIRDWVGKGHVSVIPLRVGSGTRMKAFEAMAMGRPVVSTGLGIEGLDIVPDSHFLQADDARSFARSILRLLDDKALRTRIAKDARQRVEDRFAWANVARQFEAICQRAYERAARYENRPAAE